MLDVHDLHIWTLGSNTHALCSHVLIDDMPHSESEAILKKLAEVCCGLGIHHTTIQFEHVPCVMSDNGCKMGADHVHDEHTMTTTMPTGTIITKFDWSSVSE